MNVKKRDYDEKKSEPKIKKNLLLYFQMSRPVQIKQTESENRGG